MTEFDSVIRGGTVVTAVDTVFCDVGVRDSQISALADELAPGREKNRCLRAPDAARRG